VVVDTVSEDLDMRTLQMGSASHSYRLEVSGKEKPVLTFTFDNINLPDSAHFPLESNGFIQFSIRPKLNLAQKTKIENFADIFFDFNEPVRTNTTVNRLFDMPVPPAPVILNPQEIIISPSIMQVSPQKGKAGTIVTLTGRHFSVQPGSNTVYLNSIPAEVLAATSTNLTFRVPLGATTGKIQVVTPVAGTTGKDDFVVYPPPTISQILPAEGKLGDLITIMGTHFSADASQDTIAFSGVKARIIQATDTRVQVMVPEGAPTGKVMVKTVGGQALSQEVFRVWYAPAIVNFTPDKGKVGSYVTIYGDNFSADPIRNQVKLAQTEVPLIKADATTLTVQVPAGAISGAWQLPAPIINDFLPAEGSVGALVTLSGLNFMADDQEDTVYFDTQKAKVVRSSSTSLTIQVPKGAHTGPLVVAGAGGKVISAKEFIIQPLTSEQAVQVYPNPAKGAFKIDWSKAEFAVNTLSIYSYIGKLITQKEIFSKLRPEESLMINLGNSKPGVYFIIIETSTGIIKKQIVLL
jgi:hypothetical protein